MGKQIKRLRCLYLLPIQVVDEYNKKLLFQFQVKTKRTIGVVIQILGVKADYNIPFFKKY